MIRIVTDSAADLTAAELSAPGVTVVPMTVTFADTCSIVVGPPQEQKEEFFAYDSTSLLQMILDSIQHTLQYNFVDPQQGDPSTLDIYFSMEGKDITLPDGIIVPSTSPYQGIMISDNREG